LRPAANALESAAANFLRGAISQNELNEAQESYEREKNRLFKDEKDFLKLAVKDPAAFTVAVADRSADAFSATMVDSVATLVNTFQEAEVRMSAAITQAIAVSFSFSPFFISLANPLPGACNFSARFLTTLDWIGHRPL
jgi:hypothetical protein